MVMAVIIMVFLMMFFVATMLIPMIFFMRFFVVTMFFFLGPFTRFFFFFARLFHFFEDFFNVGFYSLTITGGEFCFCMVVGFFDFFLLGFLFELFKSRLPQLFNPLP